MLIKGSKAGQDRAGHDLYKVDSVVLSTEEKEIRGSRDLVLKVRLERVVAGEPVFSGKLVPGLWPEPGFIN